MSQFVVAAFYKFVAIDASEELRASILAEMQAHHIRGTVLIAAEGINGTVAGSRADMDSFLGLLGGDSRFAQLEIKESSCQAMPFARTKVKLKREIVTMGVEGIDPNQLVGTYVEPEQWNALISDPQVTVIDTRNDYEVAIGAFENAVNPATNTFREFPSFADRKLDPKKHKKIAMYCTGGIRCEKSTAYLKQQGFDEVYHLRGGILKYLEEVPEEDSLWAGECFVFDERVAVDHQLKPGQYDQCHACRHPISVADKQSDSYVVGVSCPHCIEIKTQEQRRGFAEREKQARLARKRNEPHIGGDIADLYARRREEKLRRKNDQRRKSGGG